MVAFRNIENVPLNVDMSETKPTVSEGLEWSFSPPFRYVRHMAIILIGPLGSWWFSFLPFVAYDTRPFVNHWLPNTINQSIYSASQAKQGNWRLHSHKSIRRKSRKKLVSLLVDQHPHFQMTVVPGSAKELFIYSVFWTPSISFFHLNSWTTLEQPVLSSLRIPYMSKLLQIPFVNILMILIIVL